MPPLRMASSPAADEAAMPFTPGRTAVHARKTSVHRSANTPTPTTTPTTAAGHYRRRDGLPAMAADALPRELA